MEPLSDDLADQLAEILRDRVENRGFALPAHAVVISVNGSMQYFGCKQESDGWIVEKLAQHMELEGFQLPINVIVIDHSGQRVSRSVLDEDGEVEFLH
jgi:hypothetical protein